jgi:hypothetical protein
MKRVTKLAQMFDEQHINYRLSIHYVHYISI